MTRVLTGLACLAKTRCLFGPPFKCWRGGFLCSGPLAPGYFLGPGLWLRAKTGLLRVGGGFSRGAFFGKRAFCAAVINRVEKTLASASRERFVPGQIIWYSAAPYRAAPGYLGYDTLLLPARLFSPPGVIPPLGGCQHHCIGCGGAHPLPGATFTSRGRGFLPR